jgi:hypothetical protein
MQFTSEELTAMKKRLQASPRLSRMFSSLNAFVEASEYDIIQLMVQNNIWIGTVPSDPQPNMTGNAELGLFDYWLNNPDGPVMTYLAILWGRICGGLPKTQIDAANYAALKTAVAVGQPGLIAADGTWISENTYGALEPLWAIAVGSYRVTYANGDLAPFTQTPATVALQGASDSQVVIALVGDWGTGNADGYPAASVMNAITSVNPDYIIHLGDVYYAGSPSEETSNLIDVWPTSYSGKTFTLNSNHEMYSGARGYYKALGNPIFSAQAATSYFALQYGGWTIVGLDSASWSSSPLGMCGGISSSDAEPGSAAQATWLNGQGLSPQSTIVLSHHNPITYDGSALMTDDLGDDLWAQVTGPGALNGAPAAWYWGHVHNGIVYPYPNALLGATYGRCLGHGALPFGKAWGLAALPSSQVQAYADTANGDAPDSYPWVMNGFVILTITKEGVVTETFYDQDGSVSAWAPSTTYNLPSEARRA